MSNEVLKAIKERRSVRSYMSAPVDPRLLDQVLEAGTWAASAMNRQPARIVCVTKEEDRRQLSRMNAAVMGSDKDPYYGAPCIIIVLVDSASATGREDGSLVLGNMMLAAHSLGLGSCWINREREMFATDEGKALLKKWGIEDDLTGVGALALGYPQTQKERLYRQGRIAGQTQSSQGAHEAHQVVHCKGEILLRPRLRLFIRHSDTID